MDTLPPEVTQKPQTNGRTSSFKYLYFFLGLMFLVVLLEGGYLFYLRQTKIKRGPSETTQAINIESIEKKNQIVLEGIQKGLLEGKLTGDAILFKGKVEKIEGRTVEMFAETSDTPIFVKVEVSPEAVFFKSGNRAQGGWEILEGDHFNDIKVGSRVVFSNLLSKEGNLFGSKKVIFEE